MYKRYIIPMKPSTTSSTRRDRDSLSVELGSWFKAHATGRGVIAIPAVVVVVGVLELARALMR
jgi:hypothetical protein